MDLLSFLLGSVCAFVIIIAFAFISAYRDAKSRYKMQLELLNNLSKQNEIKKVGRPRKTTEKGE